MSAFAIDTLNYTVFGNKRIKFGRVTLISGDVSGSIDTQLGKVEAFLMSGVEKWTQSAGVVTITTLIDPAAAAGTQDWIAIGR